MKVKAILSMVIAAFLATIYGTVFYGLDNADTKIIKYINEWDVSRGWFGITFFIPGRIAAEDVNYDDIKDLIFSYSDMTVVNDGFSWHSYHSCLIFFGKSEWSSSVEENDAEIKIIALNSYRTYELASNKIAHINGVGNYMVFINSPGFGRPEPTEMFFLVPVDLSPGTYMLNDIVYKVFSGLDHRWDCDFPILAPNITIFDSFLVMWGITDTMLTHLYTMHVLLMVPYSSDGDTVDVYSCPSYKAFRLCERWIDYYSYSHSTHTITTPGDLNGDGFNDLLLIKNGPLWHPQSTNSVCAYSPIAWRYSWIAGGKRTQTHILWGRPTWEGYTDYICPDTFTTRYSTILHDTNAIFLSTPEGEYDIDNDGYADIIISEISGLYNIAGRGDTIDTTLLEVPEDTSKLYIIFGRRDFPRMFRDSINHIADVIIKSRHNSDGKGGPISVGDYNGDGYKDILTCAPSIYPEVAFLFLGNPERRYPHYFDQADIIIRADSQFVYQYTHNLLYSTIYPTAARLADINGDSLDDIILAYVRFRYRDLIPPEFYPLPLLYVFFNRRPTPTLSHPDTNIIENPNDSVCLKILFKQPLALHTLLLTVSGDTFTIDSPQVSYNPAESLLCFIPSHEWDTSAIIPFCVERLEDTIGTAMRERWCVRFNDSTWSVSEPKKPERLSLAVFPNPFNSEARIKIYIPTPSDIRIDIYDISGRQIDYIYRAKLSAGEHTISWRPSADVPSGVYIIRAKAGDSAVVRRAVLVR